MSGVPRAAATPGEQPQALASSSDGEAARVWWADWEAIKQGDGRLSGLPQGPGVSVMRSAQLDAQRLDEELKAMLSVQMQRALSMISPEVLGRLQPELSALMDLVFFSLTIWRGKPTPGMRLMNLRFRDEMRCTETPQRTGVEGPGLSTGQRLALGAVMVGGRYAWMRLHSIAAAQRWRDADAGSWKRRCWSLLALADDGIQVARLVNFLVFLRGGKYRTLLERAVSARLVYEQPSMQRAISFDFLNRQLVWQELSELILTILPIVNPEKLQALVLRWMPLPGQAGSGVQEILNPFAALPCGHIFCYYCLRSRTEADRRFCCPQCGTRVEAVRAALPRVPDAALKPLTWAPDRSS